MSDTEQLLHNIFLQEQQSNLYHPSKIYSQDNYNDMYYAYMNLPKFVSEVDDTAKSVIPRIMHYLWFTKEANPKQIPEKFLDNFKLELAKLNNYNINKPEQWKVKLWISCKACIAPSLELISKLEYPVEVVKWQSELFKNRSYLKESVTNLINLKNNNGLGTAVDIARYIIAEKHGGFFLDFSYNTGNSTEIVVQRGYHSITSYSENYYFGFKAQHKLLTWLNEEISTLFKIIEKHNMNYIISSLDSDGLATVLSYGPYLYAVSLFSGKEDLCIIPDWSICNINELPIDRSELSYTNLFDTDDIKPQCAIKDAPEICYVADHQDSFNHRCSILLIKHSLIDFGYDDRSLGGTWQESWQEST